MLYIIANERDHSILLIEQELKKRAIDHKRLKYKDISIVRGLLHAGKDSLKIGKQDLFLLRSPWNTPFFTREFTTIARSIAETYPDQILFDGACYRHHLPFYQDKLYQGLFYKRIGVKTPDVWYVSHDKYIDRERMSFPIVLKKRASARSRSNYKINSRDELQDHIYSVTLKDWVFQEYIPAVRDIRVNILNGTILYALERNMHVKDGNRLTVHGGKPLERIPKQIQRDAKKIGRALEADFLGIDFLESTSGDYYVIEANMTPQFNRAQEILPVDTVALVTDAVERRLSPRRKK